MVQSILNTPKLAITTLAIVAVIGLFAIMKGVVTIRPDEIGVYVTRWSDNYSFTDCIEAINSDIQYHPKLLTAGTYFKSPLMYKVYKLPRIVVPQYRLKELQ